MSSCIFDEELDLPLDAVVPWPVAVLLTIEKIDGFFPIQITNITRGLGHRNVWCLNVVKETTNDIKHSV